MDQLHTQSIYHIITEHTHTLGLSYVFLLVRCFVLLDNPAMLDGVLRQEKKTELSTLQGGRMKQCKKLLRLLYAEDTYICKSCRA